MAGVIERRRIIIKGARAYFIIMPDLGTSNFKEISRHCARSLNHSPSEFGAPCLQQRHDGSQFKKMWLWICVPESNCGLC